MLKSTNMMNNLKNELGESFFGPIVEDDIVKIGIIINQLRIRWMLCF